MITNCRTVLLGEIASVERGKNNTVYPAGTVCIRISACRCSKNSLRWWVLAADTTLDGSNYAIVRPKTDVIPHYLGIALECSVDEFFSKCFGKSINISIDLFNFYTLQFHDDLSDQQTVVNLIKLVDNEIEAVEREIEATKEIEKYFLDNMFVK